MRSEKIRGHRESRGRWCQMGPDGVASAQGCCLPCVDKGKVGEEGGSEALFCL